MIWLWILGILIVLAVLICRTRIGVRVRFGEAPPAAVLTIGPFRIPLTRGAGKRTPSKAPACKKAGETSEKIGKRGEKARLSQGDGDGRERGGADHVAAAEKGPGPHPAKYPGKSASTVFDHSRRRGPSRCCGELRLCARRCLDCHAGAGTAAGDSGSPCPYWR